MKWLDGIMDSMDMSLSKLQEVVEAGVLQPMGSQESDTILAAEQQQLLHALGGAENQGDMPQSQPTLSCLNYALTPRGHPHLPSPKDRACTGGFYCRYLTEECLEGQA